MSPMDGTITLHSTDGGGFAKKVTIREGTTVGEVFHGEKGSSADDAKYRILVDGKGPVSADEKLHDGQRVTISPANIKGA